jgi:hypothetical protein
MVLSLIYGKFFGYYEQMRVGTITFDNTISENYFYTSRVTSYPVERGTIISDHILNLPDRIVLSGLISDTPLNMFAPFNRSIAAFNALIALHESRSVVSVQTGLKSYDNMAILSLEVPRTIKTGQTLTFNIELQRIVYSDVISVFNDPLNLQSGTYTTISNQIVADNDKIPFIQYDPPGSLKDQASSNSNVGTQTLDPIPTGSAANINTNKNAIQGRS